MMRIEFRGLAASDPLVKYAEQRVFSWIGHPERGLASVTVCLATETGGEGPQTRCRMEARPLPRAKVVVNVVVEETSVDPHDAVDRTAERLATVINHLSQARLIQKGAA